MKKYFFLVLLFFIPFFSFVSRSFAQTAIGTNSALEITPTPVATGVVYDLPYPGLLPDNPFYLIKIFRDKLIDILISNPLKKSQFDLLQADKRLNAGVYLAKEGGNKDSYISSVVSKAENYFELSVSHVKEAKQQGIDVSIFVERLITASQKHQEVIKNLEQHAVKSLQQELQIQKARAVRFEKEAKSYRLSK